MPTDVIKTIGATSSPITPDYTSLQAWEDAIPVDLVAADERHIGECLNQGEFTSTGTILQIAGQTVDATRNIILRCAAGASFADNASVRSNALFYNASNGVGLRGTGAYSRCIGIDINYTRIEGLQIKGFTNASFSHTINLPNGAVAANSRFDTCIIECNGNPSQGQNELAGTIVNCLIIQHHTAGNGIDLEGSAANIQGCTIVAPNGSSGTAVTSYGGTNNMSNCAVFGFAAFKSGTFAGSHNATDLGAVGFGTNNQVSLTFASQFESSTNDFRAVASGSLDLNGTPDLTNLTEDISGTNRHASTPTIGCWEVVAAAAGNRRRRLICGAAA